MRDIVKTVDVPKTINHRIATVQPTSVRCTTNHLFGKNEELLNLLVTFLLVMSLLIMLLLLMYLIQELGLQAIRIIEMRTKLLAVSLDSSTRPTGSLPTTCLMVIRRPDEQGIIQAPAKLDTAASKNLITRQFASSLGLEVGPYYGARLRPIGPLFRPGGLVSFNWRVSGKQTNYTTTFAVLEDHDCQGLDFDILLCEDEIKKINFYLRNTAVFYFQ
ncbi:MAG: hypothetical protein Q9181_004964 [Wetmoreana brouardii]